ncbi:hypothetical protein Patl1_27798 [Pistacia atlantica]|uniref:Uncharacterized protein n=1 Tax=Pistacia atlantica TaxID=434234 RepID=A0ACC1BDF5_9ROSI|nr:hypothetical protein Patl1_27798 [Pistacia atlantica]
MQRFLLLLIYSFFFFFFFFILFASCRVTAQQRQYCVQNDQEIRCQCLPGYASIKEGSQASGCQNIFSPESCNSTDGNIKYNIETVANISWEDSEYSNLKSQSKDECEQACLKDCSCEAAMFKDGKCTKQKLPMRYGRQQKGNSNIILIKVVNLTSAFALKEGAANKGSKKEHQTDILIVSVSLTAFTFTILTVVGILVYRNRVCKYNSICANGKIPLEEDVGPKSFTYSELLEATNNFNGEVGRGAFGTVFRGETSHNQKAIAVKRLDRVSTEGEREFQTEMKAIGRTHHRNLVRLLGYCHEGPNRLLVYEYMSNVVRDEDVDKLQLERTVKVGLWCIQYEPSLRPSMKKVLLMLEDIVDIPLPPNPTSSLSAI